MIKCLLSDMYKHWEDTAGSEMNKRASAPLRNLQFCADRRYSKKSSPWIYSAVSTVGPMLFLVLEMSLNSINSVPALMEHSVNDF